MTMSGATERVARRMNVDREGLEGALGEIEQG